MSERSEAAGNVPRFVELGTASVAGLMKLCGLQIFLKPVFGRVLDLMGG